MPSIHEKLLKLQGKKETLQEQATRAQSEIGNLVEDIRITESAQTVTTEVAKKIQAQLSLCLEEIAQSALDAVFQSSNYTFRMEFTTKANRSCVDIYLLQDGHRIDMMDGNGGGLVDIVTFALRLGVWSLGNTDNVLILDEPFKNLSGREMQELGADILKTLTSRLGIQTIMVIDETLTDFVEVADMIVAMEKHKSRSRRKE